MVKACSERLPKLNYENALACMANVHNSVILFFTYSELSDYF